jgi:hypothetical protein
MLKYILMSIAAIVFIFGFIAVAHAIPSEYSVTSNYHGIDTPLDANVVVTATTTDTSVYQVTFIWRDASQITRYTDVVPVSSGTAVSTHQPDSLGDWGVQALFQSPDGTTKEGITEVIVIRATSFNTIPEIPLLGTAGIAVAMILGLTYKTKKKPTK